MRRRRPEPVQPIVIEVQVTVSERKARPHRDTFRQPPKRRLTLVK